MSTYTALFSIAVKADSEAEAMEKIDAKLDSCQEIRLVGLFKATPEQASEREVMLNHIRNDLGPTLADLIGEDEE